MSSSERRRSQREPARQRCTLQMDDTRLSGVVVDRSAVGLGLLLQRLPAGLRLQSGMRLSLTIEAEDGSGATAPAQTCRVRVVWVDAVTGGRRLGVAFDEQ